MTPEKLHSYSIYEDGNEMVGIADEIDLPGFEFLSETLTGQGIAGEIEDPTMGLTKAMEWEPKFRTLYKTIDLNPMRFRTYTIRGAQQGKDAYGNIKMSGIKALVGGRPKGFSGGKLKKASPIEPGFKLEVTYYKLEVDGTCLFEIDKLNSKCIINGVDVLGEVKKYL